MSLAVVLLYFVIMLIVTTAVLAGVLTIFGEGLDRDMLLKCLGINTGVLVFSLIPYLGMLSPVIWLAAVMAVFEKSFVEAILVALSCWVVKFVAFIGLGILAGGGAVAGQPPLVVHAHDARFDIVDPAGNVLRTVASVEEVLSALQNPSMTPMLRGGTVLVRCQLDPSGLPTGDAAELSAKLGSIPGVRSVRWEGKGAGTDE